MDIKKQTINKVLDNLYIWIIGQKRQIILKLIKRKVLFNKKEKWFIKLIYYFI
jgi:hypothetical protein